MNINIDHLRFNAGETPPAPPFASLAYVRNPAVFKEICRNEVILATNAGDRRLVVLLAPGSQHDVIDWAVIEGDQRSPHYGGGR